MSNLPVIDKGTRQYMKRGQKLSFGRNIGNPLPRNNFYFAITNDGKKFGLYLDGIEVTPKQFDDFTIEGWHYKATPPPKLSQRLRKAWRYIRHG